VKDRVSGREEKKEEEEEKETRSRWP